MELASKVGWARVSPLGRGFSKVRGGDADVVTEGEGRPTGQGVLNGGQLGMKGEALQW